MNQTTKTSVVQATPAENPCFGCSGCSHNPLNPAPKITVIPGISSAHDHGLEYDHADLLVLGKVTASDLGPGPMAFDAHHGGAVSRAIVARQFRGDLGELLHVEEPPVEPSGKTRHIAVIGLGKAEDLTRKNMCHFFNYALALAQKTNVRSLLLPVFPQRTAGQTLNLRAMGAILRCLVDERSRRGTLGALEEIQLLCVPQARRHLEAGLAVEHTLCTVCRIPNLG